MRRERLLLAALLGAFVVALSRGAGSPPFVPDIPAPAPVVTPARKKPRRSRVAVWMGEEPIVVRFMGG